MKYYFEIYKSRGQWRWRARHRNSKIVCDGGEGYLRRKTLLSTLRRFVAAVENRECKAILLPYGDDIPL